MTAAFQAIWPAKGAEGPGLGRSDTHNIGEAMVLTIKPFIIYGEPMVVQGADPLSTLRQRLRSIEAEIADIDERRPKLVKLLATYRALLNQEEAMQGDADIDESAVPAFHPTQDNRSLADLIVRALGTGPKTLEELKDIGIASGWAPVKESAFPGRAINFALVGLQKGGYVERKDKVWKLAPVRAGRDTGGLR